MYINECGFSIFDGDDLIQLLYQGHFDKISNLLVLETEETIKFNQMIFDRDGQKLKLYRKSDLEKDNLEYVHQKLQQNWLMPEKYKTLNLSAYLLAKCNTREQKARVIDELAEFNRRDMRMLLRFMIYLVDFMIENGIVWGVGRGSSVSSYVLFLIGVHKVDSLKYNLDFKEFIR